MTLDEVNEMMERSLKRNQDRAELLKSMLLEANTKADIRMPAIVELVSLLQRANSDNDASTSEKILSIQEKLIKLPLQEAFLSFWQSQEFLLSAEIKQLSELFSYQKEPSFQAWAKAEIEYLTDLRESRYDRAALAAEAGDRADLDAKHWFEREVKNLQQEFSDFAPCPTQILVTWLNSKGGNPSNVVHKEGNLVDQEPSVVTEEGNLSDQALVATHLGEDQSVGDICQNLFSE